MENKRDISTLFDPSIVCADNIQVNTVKKKGFIVYVVALVFFLYMLSMSILNHITIGIVFGSIMVVLLIGGMIRYYRQKNPVLIIDKQVLPTTISHTTGSASSTLDTTGMIPDTKLLTCGFI